MQFKSFDLIKALNTDLNERYLVLTLNRALFQETIIFRNILFQYSKKRTQFKSFDLRKALDVDFYIRYPVFLRSGGN